MLSLCPLALQPGARRRGRVRRVAAVQSDALLTIAERDGEAWG